MNPNQIGGGKGKTPPIASKERGARVARNRTLSALGAVATVLGGLNLGQNSNTGARSPGGFAKR